MTTRCLWRELGHVQSPNRNDAHPRERNAPQTRRDISLPLCSDHAVRPGTLRTVKTRKGAREMCRACSRPSWALEPCP